MIYTENIHQNISLNKDNSKWKLKTSWLKPS